MEYTFKFDELEIDISQVNQVLGYQGTALPKPFDSNLETALKDARNLKTLNVLTRLLAIP